MIKVGNTIKSSKQRYEEISDSITFIHCEYFHSLGRRSQKIEILGGWEKSDGSIVYGLKISLNEGWKTYWHTPGPFGFKPQFDFEGSLNISNLNVLWPSPKIFGSSSFETIGYENEVILPIAIKAEVDSDPINLKIKGSIGICYDVCMPIEFEAQSGLKIISLSLIHI